MKLYSCDLCGKTLHSEHDSRFVWKIDGQPAARDDESTVLEGDDQDSDLDSVESVDELLLERETLETHEENDNSESETLEMLPVCVRRSYDVCGGCYMKLVNDPLGLEARKSRRPFSRN